MESRDRQRPETPEKEDEAETTVYLRIPYIGSHSLQFGKQLGCLLQGKFDIQVKVAFYTFKVGSYFVLKDKVPSLFRSNSVYQFTCSCDRNISYIGMTGRQWFVRIGEHLNRRGNCNSAVFTHLAECRICRESNSKQDNFRVLKNCRSERETEIREAMCIRRFKPSLNVQLGNTQGASFLLRVFR